MNVRKILCAIDLSEASEHVGEVAARLAKTSGASLDLVHARVPPPLPPPGIDPGVITAFTAINERLRKDQERLGAMLEERRKKLAETGIEVGLRVIEDRPAQAILQAADEGKHDLVVIGPHAGGAPQGPIARQLFGSTAQRVIRHAGCAVLVVGKDDPFFRGKSEGVVVGVDFARSCADEIEWAKWLAERAGASLHLVHAVDLGEVVVFEPMITESVIRALRAGAEASLQRVASESKIESAARFVGMGRPDDVLDVEAGDGGAVVVAARGLGPVARVLLGSTTERLIRSGRTPLLVVRSKPA